MPKIYRKCPVDVEVIEWTGKNGAEIKAWAGAAVLIVGFGRLTVHTREGDMRAQVGDLIIKGVEGEFYPIKPSIFAKTYMEVTLPEKAK